MCPNTTFLQYFKLLSLSCRSLTFSFHKGVLQIARGNDLPKAIPYISTEIWTQISEARIQFTRAHLTHSVNSKLLKWSMKCILISRSLTVRNEVLFMQCEQQAVWNASPSIGWLAHLYWPYLGRGKIKQSAAENAHHCLMTLMNLEGNNLV